MPFVKISALPSEDFDCSTVMEKMETAFADHPDLGLVYGTTTFMWQTLDCITHRLTGETAPRSRREFNPSDIQIPVFVDLYITSVFTYSQIKDIMETITTSLHEHTKIPRESVFIHTHVAQPGQAYISDSVWPCLLSHPGDLACRKPQEGQL